MDFGVLKVDVQCQFSVSMRLRLKTDTEHYLNYCPYSFTASINALAWSTGIFGKIP